MIRIGDYNKLKVQEIKADKYVLGDHDESIDFSLDDIPHQLSVGDYIKVFVYLDRLHRMVVSTRKPLIEYEEIAFLPVKKLDKNGAYFDWGMESLLFVPQQEQNQEMEEGKSYFLYLDLDEKTNTFYGSNHIEGWLQNQEIDLQIGERVKVLIWRKTDLGYAVIVNDEHEGLIYENEIFKSVDIGQKMVGYIKKVREENKLDVSLQPIGYRKANDKFTETIIVKLYENDGFLPYNDKSSPESIYNTFGMSKKAFKKAIGGLYKNRIIAIGKEGISMVKP